MLADVKTVALTAAGHLVAPAAGSKIEMEIQTVRVRRSPIACHGLSTTTPKELCSCWKRGTSKAAGTDKSSETSESSDTGMWADFRAQTKEHA
mmetsp:Transcript_135349/g.191501  ORF Transcript_135349/g.191501 Transcript_135349/m.191501 type:complete len:93 (-) Transcript_135349:574-852(-)